MRSRDGDRVAVDQLGCTHRREGDSPFPVRRNSIFLGLALLIIARLMLHFLLEYPPPNPSLRQTLLNVSNPSDSTEQLLPLLITDLNG